MGLAGGADVAYSFGQVVGIRNGNRFGAAITSNLYDQEMFPEGFASL